MAEISAGLVKELRERTGAGFMDCKRALEETGGDLDKAVALLRERGVAAAEKKSGREARQGQGVLAVRLGAAAAAFGEIAHPLGIGQADLPALLEGEVG